MVMAKAKYTGPADRLELYEDLVGSVEDVERKGAANPYTSRNGWMQSFLGKEGEIAIRLPKDDLASFLRDFETEKPVSYGAVMKDFAIVPDDLLERQEEAREWFIKSWDWVGTLEPK